MIAKRSDVPQNVERSLWAESCGHCSNPTCMKRLIVESNTRNIGVMAHIVPHRSGGEVTFDNLILLCQNCHVITEPTRVENGEETLREWKRLVDQRNTQRFSEKYVSFERLEQRVKPILERNHFIFANYGPESEIPNSSVPDTYDLWKSFENELIANNSILKGIFLQNLGLFHFENKETIKTFMLHVDEFVQTRDREHSSRFVLFPHSLLSIFGIEAECTYPSQNLSALQNLVTDTANAGNFIALDFFPEPTLTIKENGENKTLSLNDRSRMNQIYFSRKLYQPRKTDVPFNTLMFYLSWFSRNKIDCVIEDIHDLTTLTINGTHRVKLLYSYMVSINDVRTRYLTQSIV